MTYNMLKSLANWTGHNQRNRDFCTDLSDGWWRRRCLAILRHRRVTSPTSCHGEWTSWTLQALGPHVFTFQGAADHRLEIRCHNFDVFSHSKSRLVSTYDCISFSWCLGVKRDIMRHMTLDESTTTRSSSQLLNLIFCDVLVMMSLCQDPLARPLLWWCPPGMSPFPLSCQSQCLVFLPFLSAFPIFFPSRLPLCLLCLRWLASSEFFWHRLTRRKRCQNQLPVPPMHEGKIDAAPLSVLLLRWSMNYAESTKSD